MTICVVGLVVGLPSLVAVVWIVVKSGLVLRLIHALERRGEQ